MYLAHRENRKENKSNKAFINSQQKINEIILSLFVFNKDSFTFFDLLNDYLFEIEKFIVPNLLSAKV